MNKSTRVAPLRRALILSIAIVAAVTWNVSVESEPAHAANPCAWLGHDASGYYSQGGGAACHHYTLTVAVTSWGAYKNVYGPSAMGSTKAYAPKIYWPYHATNIFAQSNYVI